MDRELGVETGPAGRPGSTLLQQSTQEIKAAGLGPSQGDGKMSDSR